MGLVLLCTEPRGRTAQAAAGNRNLHALTDTYAVSWVHQPARIGASSGCWCYCGASASLHAHWQKGPQHGEDAGRHRSRTGCMGAPNRLSTTEDTQAPRIRCRFRKHWEDYHSCMFESPSIRNCKVGGSETNTVEVPHISGCWRRLCGTCNIHNNSESNPDACCKQTAGHHLAQDTQDFILAYFVKRLKSCESFSLFKHASAAGVAMGNPADRQIGILQSASQGLGRLEHSDSLPTNIEHNIEHKGTDTETYNHGLLITAP
jgi:hypothetical protein